MRIEKHFLREEVVNGFVPSVTLYLLDRVESPLLRPMVIICPGGGYVMKAENWEGERIAVEYNRAGFNAAVLDYSVYPIHHPQPLLDALAQAAQGGPQHQYSITFGAENLRQCIADKYSSLWGRSIDPDSEVVVTCGSTEAMMAAMMTVCDPGDNVIVFRQIRS